MACLSPYVPQSAYIGDLAFPCGHCYNCRLRRCSQWVFRLKREWHDHSRAYFVTLTYKQGAADRSPNNYLTLNKRHVQLYFKQLRIDLTRAGYQHGIKYFAVGEYGGRRGRPHYHIILFGAPEAFIGAAWRHEGEPRGFVDIRPLNYGRIGYTLKYVLKPRFAKHGRDDRAPEFQLRSLGLGKNYLTPQMVAYHQIDPTRVFVQDGRFKVAMPRYYKDKIFSEGDKEYQRDVSVARMRESLDREKRAYIETFGTLDNFYSSRSEKNERIKLNAFKKAQSTRMRL